MTAYQRHQMAVTMEILLALTLSGLVWAWILVHLWHLACACLGAA